MNRKHVAGLSLALAGLAAGGTALASDPRAGATVAAEPGLLQAVPEQVTSGQGRAAMDPREPETAKAARLDTKEQAALARQLAARRAAAHAASVRKAAASRASRSTVRAPIYTGNARGLAQGMLGSYGWSSSQFSCLDPLWTHESGWSTTAGNSSGAYGIPQALPGSKMASAGSDWRTNPRTQIAWGLSYISGRYGTPCGAWAHFQSNGWY